MIHIETESNEFTTFSEVFERLTRALKSNEHFFDQSDHQMQNLMIANARVTNKATNLNQMLEIRVMWLIYQEMPSLALIFTDITERNLVVQLQDTNDYKNRLLASVSHELRTPLNASLNFIQAAIEDPQIPIHISEDFLAPSLTSNQLLLHLINDILDFSQMSANKLRLTYEKCDVGKTLGDCVNLMKLQASKKGLELLLEFDCETLDSEFITDHTRLKQIILNLLSNAVKFTLHGMIKVKAVLSNSMEKGKILKVEVSDTGIGISEENQKKLFKSFEKVDLGEQAFLNSTGVGLGLVISSNLVLMLGPEEKNNGIKIKSRENEGTTFSFWIVNKELSSKSKLDISYRSENYNNQMDELDVQRDTQLFETQGNLISLGSPSTRRRFLPVKMHPLLSNHISPGISQRCTCPSVLIVDDDVFNITALSMILKQLGQTCDRAYNGQQAIEKIFERQEVKCGPSCQQYKLIFMDYSMPIMDGFEATRKLKELMSSWELPLITIIGCTAFVQEKELKRGIEAGMDGYCIKPLNKCKIGAILTKLAH